MVRGSRWAQGVSGLRQEFINERLGMQWKRKRWDRNDFMIDEVKRVGKGAPM